MNNISEKNIAIRVSVITILVNFLLTAFKFVAGILGNSMAIISDAVHSASDVLSTIIVIIGVIIASKPMDKLHQYGHERFESVASIFLAILLAITGGILGYNAIKSLAYKEYLNITSPTLLALSAAIVSIIVKEIMFWYTRYYAKKINSVSLKADAWHHRSDALSSVGSLIGVGGAMLGLPVFDVIASLIICLFILKVAISIFKEAIDGLIDRSCDEKTINDIKEIIMSVNGIIEIDDLKTRIFSNKIYVDIEIGCYKNLTLITAHNIAEEVHDKIEAYDKKIKHCMVHVNPVDIENIEKNTIDILKGESRDDN